MWGFGQAESLIFNLNIMYNIGKITLKYTVNLWFFFIFFGFSSSFSQKYWRYRLRYQICATWFYGACLLTKCIEKRIFQTFEKWTGPFLKLLSMNHEFPLFLLFSCISISKPKYFWLQHILYFICWSSMGFLGFMGLVIVKFICIA